MCRETIRRQGVVFEQRKARRAWGRPSLSHERHNARLKQAPASARSFLDHFPLISISIHPHSVPIAAIIISNMSLESLDVLTALPIAPIAQPALLLQAAPAPTAPPTAPTAPPYTLLPAPGEVVLATGSRPAPPLAAASNQTAENDLSYTPSAHARPSIVHRVISSVRAMRSRVRRTIREKVMRGRR